MSSPAAFQRTGGTVTWANNLEQNLPAGRHDGHPRSPVVSAGNIAGDGVPGNADATDQDFALVISNAERGIRGRCSSHDAADARHLDRGRRRRRRRARAGRGVRARRAARATPATPVRAPCAARSPAPRWRSRRTSSAWLEPGGRRDRQRTSSASPASSRATRPAAPTSRPRSSLTTAGGPHTVPLTLPTGVAGPPAARTSHARRRGSRSPTTTRPASRPRSTSRRPARIKDIDVRIARHRPSLGRRPAHRHRWRPTGRPCTLVDQPGGP